MNFDELERALASRAKPLPGAALERRVLTALSREAARERRNTLFALAACLCAFVGLGAWSARIGPLEAHTNQSATVVVVSRFLGRDPSGAELARIPRIAPLRGASFSLSGPEGL